MIKFNYMTDNGNNNLTIVYFDFCNISTFQEVLLKTKARYIELCQQGFSESEVRKIIFCNSQFQASFLGDKYFLRLKNEIACPNTR